MKKVYAWLSDDERRALAEHCQREGKSMYSVLKEAVGRIVQGESPSSFSLTPKQDSEIVTPSQTVQVIPSGLEQEVLNLKRSFDNIQKEVNKIGDHELLWHDISELKAGMAGVTKEMEQLKEHFEDTIAITLQKLLREQEEVKHDFR